MFTKFFIFSVFSKALKGLIGFSRFFKALQGSKSHIKAIRPRRALKGQVGNQEKGAGPYKALNSLIRPLWAL